MDDVTLDDAILLMVIAAEKVQRNPPASGVEDAEYRATWGAILREAGVQAVDVMPAFVRFSAANEFFPAPKQIAVIARDIHREREAAARAAERAKTPALPRPEPEQLTPEEFAERRRQIKEKLGLTPEYMAERERQRTSSGDRVAGFKNLGEKAKEIHEHLPKPDVS